VEVLGTTKVRDCCVFHWRQAESSRVRVVRLRGYHCDPCVRELGQVAKVQRVMLTGSVMMDRVRELLAQKRAELQDRWDRQLRAASEAGFPLDHTTSHLLPQLLEATTEALERRFRLPEPGAPAPAAGGRRAAVQGSLLADFLFDAILEHEPSLSGDEQRRLSDSLAHAAMEVLVRHQLEGELDRRRRDGDRFTRLGHQLRNSMTAAQLALGLLQKRGEMRDSRAVRLLEDSLARLRAGLEDTLLDELLSQGGLRLSRIKLDRVAAEARGDTEPEARERGVQLVLDEASRVEFTGDTRLMRPAVRALVRVALDLSRRGATVRMQCAKRRHAARLAVLVDRCRKRPNGRLGSVSGLALVRRAARAHGGEVKVRGTPGEGCTLTLELPLTPES
jgi:signal transduction histidine kinase